MLYLVIKAAISRAIIAIVSEVAKRNPALGALIVSFWVSLLVGCALTIALYISMTWLGPRFGLQL